jgi:hypothetical protein
MTTEGGSTMTETNAAPPTTGTATDTGLHDRELDLPRRAPRRRRIRVEGLEPYQRLVANPFLAVLGLIGWYALMAYVLRGRRIDLFFPSLGSLGLVIFLFQYHCLDCGATGRLTRWRGHCCAAVKARRDAGRRHRFRGPSPWAQTVVMLLVLGYMVLLGTPAIR